MPSSFVPATLRQTGLELFPLGQEIPIKMPGESAGRVGETMLHIEREFSIVERSQYRPAAFRPQIECQKVLCRHTITSPPKMELY